MENNVLVEELKAATAQLRANAEKQASLEGKVSDSLKQAEEKMQARISELEAKLNAPRQTASEAASSEEQERKAAFRSFLVKGADRMSPAELKLLNVGTDPEGGYLAPKELVSTIEKNLTEVSPIRMLAKRIQTNRKAVEYLKRTGLPTANWAVESEDISGNESTSTYGMGELPVHKLTAISYATMEQLSDSAWNVEAELRGDIVEQFAATEGTAFVTGNGVKRPYGFLATGSGIESVTTVGAGAMVADDILDLRYKLKSFYADRGAFLMHKDVVKAVRKLKDSQNRYLWEPSVQAGTPSSLLGRPLYEANDMATGVTTTGAIVMAFGDFASGYTIVDHTEVSMVRDAMTLAHKGQVRFVVHKRVGGGVTKGEAIAKLTIQ